VTTIPVEVVVIALAAGGQQERYETGNGRPAPAVPTVQQSHGGGHFRPATTVPGSDADLIRQVCPELLQLHRAI